MKALKAFQYIIIGISVTLLVLLTAVEIASFSLSSHVKLFEKYRIAEATNLDEGTLEAVMKDVLEYFRDDRELLDTTITVDSQEVPAFGERAIFHMIDVKYLFVIGRIIRNVSLALLVILGVHAWKLDRRWRRNFKRTLGCTALINLSLVGILFLLMNLNFYKYFTHFHEIFFSNDLWILDPKTELLIQMLPEGFFMDTAFKIAALFVGGNIMLGALSLIPTKSSARLFGN